MMQKLAKGKPGAGTAPGLQLGYIGFPCLREEGLPRHTVLGAFNQNF